MHEARTSTALRQLSGLGREPDPPGWTWAVISPERTGRLRLPTRAYSALGAQPGTAVRVVGLCQREALVLRRHGDTRPMTIDRRGRVYLPVAMRADRSTLLVGVNGGEGTVVIVATTVLERLGDVPAGGLR